MTTALDIFKGLVNGKIEPDDVFVRMFDYNSGVQEAKMEERKETLFEIKDAIYQGRFKGIDTILEMIKNHSEKG